MNRMSQVPDPHHQRAKRSLSSLAWIPGEARWLAAAGMLRGRVWSLAQVCEHLALSMEGTIHPIEHSAPQHDARRRWFSSIRRVFVKHAVLISGRLPDGLPAQPFVRPSDSPPLDPTIRRLGTAIEALERKLAEPAARWPRHPVFGELSGRQWLRFHALHARHHFARFDRPGSAPAGVDAMRK